ncbi:MAG: hypothetical protein NC452_05175 [Eubacterium sp.]|nr:hypothetical protein [Eubacterium sp.]
MTKNANVSDSDTKTIAEKIVTEKVATEIPHNESTTSYVYIGPSLPGARLMANTVLSGTRKDISKYYKDVIDTYPNVEKLIVPVDRLSESRTKIHTSDSILSKYYSDLLSQVQKGASK